MRIHNVQQAASVTVMIDVSMIVVNLMTRMSYFRSESGAYRSAHSFSRSAVLATSEAAVLAMVDSCSLIRRRSLFPLSVCFDVSSQQGERVSQCVSVSRPAVISTHTVRELLFFFPGTSEQCQLTVPTLSPVILKSAVSPEVTQAFLSDLWLRTPSHWTVVCSNCADIFGLSSSDTSPLAS